MKTFVFNLFAVSTLTAFIATSIPAVSALSISPAPHVARHLLHAQMARAKRNINKKRCKARLPNGTDAPSTGGGGSVGNSGGGGGGGSSGKKGLAFPMGCSDLDKWHPNTDIHWHYNWRGLPYGDCPGGFPPFIPMLWGYRFLQSFIDMTNIYTPSVALFLNEPNLGGELSSGVSPSDAASLWWQYMDPLRRRGTRIGSAATTSGPDGVEWQKNFEKECNCKPDFDCVHFYGTSPEDFIFYVTNWHNTFGRNIWVTEMACQDFTGGPQCNMGQVYDFVARVSHWCETTPWIEKYTFFGAMSDVQNVNPLNKMMDWDNGPNDLGRFMLSAY